MKPMEDKNPVPLKNPQPIPPEGDDYRKRKRFIVNLIYAGLIILIVTVVIRYGLGLLAPFVAGFLIAYGLKTPARWLSKRTGLAYKPVVLLLVLLFYSTVGVVLVLGMVKLISVSVDLVSALPSFYTAEVVSWLNSFANGVEQSLVALDPTLVDSINQLLNRFIQSLGSLITSTSVRVVNALTGYASSLPGLLIKILLMIISTFFIAGDYDLLTGFVSRQLSDKLRRLLLEVKEYVVGTLFVCIRSYAIIMSITFLELSVGLSLIGVKNGILVALLISIFDILPVLGTGGIMIPWAIITALQGSYSLSLGLVIVYVAITVIRNILEPKIVGGHLGLHPIVTLSSMFVGTQLFGVIGLFGLPIFLSLLRHLNDTGTIKLYKK